MSAQAKPSGPIVNFITKVQQANNRKAAQIVLSTQEAIDLSAALSAMLARENSLLSDIVELHKRTNAPTNIQMDGGRFK